MGYLIKLLLAKKGLRKTIIWVASICIFFLVLFISFLSTAFVAVSSPKPIIPISSSMSSKYDEVANKWKNEIKWKKPGEDDLREGLFPELIEQVDNLDLNLSSGLLKAISEFKGRYNVEDAEAIAKILSPTNLRVKEMKTWELTVTMTLKPDGSYEYEYGEKHESTILKISSLDTYQGTYTISYKTEQRDEILSQSEDSQGVITKLVKQVRSEPVVDDQTLKEDYSPLQKVMKRLGMRGKLDMPILFRQALGFDPYFNDPKALPLLPTLGGGEGSGSIAFTGSYENGEYGMDTIVTEYSGVTVQQIQEILKGTPMEGTAQAFMKAGKQYGIDPAFLVGIAGAEQSFRPFHNNAFGITGRGDAGSVKVSTGASFAAYSTMEVGIYAAARLISGSLYVKSGLVTIEDIWKRWAPNEAANDPNGLNQNWAKNVINVMARLKAM